MGWFDDIASKASALSKKYAPAALSPEKRYAKGIITVCAIVTAADGVVEESEINACNQFIQGLPEIKDYLGETEAQEMLSLILNGLMEKHKLGSAMFGLEVNKYIAELRESIQKPEWRQSVVLIGEQIASSDGQIHEKEAALLYKIRQSFGQA